MDNQDQNQNQSQNQQTPQVVQTPVVFTPNVPQPETTQFTSSPKKKKWLKPLVAFFIILVLAGLIGAYSIFVKHSKNEDQSSNQTSTYSLSSKFENVNNLSEEALLKLALKQLLSVDAVSYSVDSSGSSKSNSDIKYIFGKQYGLHTVTDSKDTNSSTKIETLHIGDSYYFRYLKNDINTDSNQLNADEKKDLEQLKTESNKYLNKWILANEATTKNVDSGSEFLGFLLTGSSSMEAPILIGNLEPGFKDLATKKIDAGIYKIVSSEKTIYGGLEAVKYSLKVNTKEFTDMVINSTKKYSAKTYIQSGFTLIGSAYGEYDVSKLSLAVWVSPKNAQILKIENNLNIDAESVPAFNGNIVIYDKFNFDNIQLPPAPTDTIPFNKYFNQ